MWYENCELDFVSDPPGRRWFIGQPQPAKLKNLDHLQDSRR